MVYTFVATFLHAVFRLLFTLEYFGVGNVPKTGPVIIAGNHPSYLDPVLIGIPLSRRVFFMAWDKLFTVPVLGNAMRAVGAFPVRLGTRDPNAFAAAQEILDEGGALGIFPEAGRSKEGPMNPLKTGTARLAIATGAPIVPVTITGAFDAWPSSRRLPWPRKITVKYHAPIVLDPTEMAERAEDREYHEEITDRLREQIERRLLPSLDADERKRKVFSRPASAIRIYEADLMIAAIVCTLLGGPALRLFLVAGLHALYLLMDIWWIPQGRLAKAARELSTPAAAILMGPLLAQSAGIRVPEWWTLAIVAAGFTLCFNWTSHYKAQRYVRGALLSYLLGFAVALLAPHPYAPQLAFASFTVVFAFAWRPLFWGVGAVVAVAYAAALVWAAGRVDPWIVVAHLMVGPLVAIYIRLVKFSAHNGRMI